MSVTLTRRHGKLPLRGGNASRPRHAHALSIDHAMAMSHKTILLIEEEPVLLDITAFRLELLGHRVEVKKTADAALDWLTDQTPDLVAVGYMSDMDPVEFLNRLSDDERTSKAPLLLLSTNSDLDEVQRAFNAGADEYLLTPYDPLVLERKVEGLLEAAALKDAE